MNLLIITQKVDKNDGVLGFFYGWIERFAKNFSRVTVICLETGVHDFYDNVKVLSLGKEDGKSKIKYFLRFYKYIWQERKNYDIVFVHMNKEYVCLGGIFWKILNKKIFLWYNHIKGNWLSVMAGCLADKIFFTSPFSFFAGWKKSLRMPAGIDTDMFKNTVDVRLEKTILYLGRLDPVKNSDVLFKAVGVLDSKGHDFKLSVYGAPSVGQESYFTHLREEAASVESKGKIKFFGPVPNYSAPQVYNNHELFINLTNSGSLDKTILEAMASESLVLVSNRSFENILPPQFLFKERNAVDLAEKIEKIWQMPAEEKKRFGKLFREKVVKEHGLDALMLNIIPQLK